MIGSGDIEGVLRRVLDPLDAGEIEGGGADRMLAGVLVPVVKEKDGSVSLMLTLRTERVKHHKGQMSFPGGMVEKGDKGFLETALRETQEEIGLAPDSVKVVGRLRTYDTITGFRVHPYVGVLDSRPVIEVSEEEIEEVYYVGLDLLMDQGVYRETSVEWEGVRLEVKAFEWGGPVIWGATANMLGDLFERMRRA